MIVSVSVITISSNSSVARAARSCRLVRAVLTNTIHIGTLCDTAFFLALSIRFAPTHNNEMCTLIFHFLYFLNKNLNEGSIHGQVRI